MTHLKHSHINRGLHTTSAAGISGIPTCIMLQLAGIACSTCRVGSCAAVISAMPDGWLVVAGSPSILYKKEDAAQQLATFV